MPFIAPELIIQAKQMDLLTYLKNYEPYELVKFSGNTYCTRTHDSLKISNGKWIWCCLLYTSPSPRDGLLSRMPSSA